MVFPFPFEIRAIVLVGLFLAFDLFSGITHSSTGIAHFAHFGELPWEHFDLLLGTQQCGATMMNAKKIKMVKMSKLILFYLRYKKENRECLGSLADDIRQNFKTGQHGDQTHHCQCGGICGNSAAICLFKNYIHSTPGFISTCILPARPVIFFIDPGLLSPTFSFMAAFFICCGIWWDSIFWANNREIFLGDRRILPLYIFGGLISE